MFGRYYCDVFFRRHYIDVAYKYHRISVASLQIRSHSHKAMANVGEIKDLNYDYDYFVIGGGSGGVRSSRIAAQYGARVALAEHNKLGLYFTRIKNKILVLFFDRWYMC